MLLLVCTNLGCPRAHCWPSTNLGSSLSFTRGLRHDLDYVLYFQSSTVTLASSYKMCCRLPSNLLIARVQPRRYLCGIVTFVFGKQSSLEEPASCYLGSHARMLHFLDEVSVSHDSATVGAHLYYSGRTVVSKWYPMLDSGLRYA